MDRTKYLFVFLIITVVSFTWTVELKAQVEIPDNVVIDETQPVNREDQVGIQAETIDDTVEEIPFFIKVIIILFFILTLSGGIILIQNRRQGVWITGKGDEDEIEDDPRDTPGPRMFGEEIDFNPDIPPAYIVSDMHIGSNRGRKRYSNNMKKKTLKSFLKWLGWVDSDVPKEYEYYNVVMNGDFFDLWQTGSSGLRQINNTNVFRDQKNKKNVKFFDALANALNMYPRMRFVYVVGNHDDPFIAHDKNTANPQTEAEKNVMSQFGERTEQWFERKFKGINPGNRFDMKTYFRRDDLSLHAEHGHFHDLTNYKKDKRRSGGQNIAEQVNRMQRKYPSYFQNLEYTPDAEMYKYLRCLLRKPHSVLVPESPNRVKKEVRKLKKVVLDNHESGVWDKVVTGLKFVFLMTSVNEEIEKELDPKKINETEQEEAEKIKDASGMKIIAFGHTHIIDAKGGGDWAYVNTGTWLKKIRYRNDYFQGCLLETRRSDYPFARIYASTENSASVAVVELISYRYKRLLANAMTVQL